ncbi:polyphenol oxidase family protein [Psychrobacter sp. B38]|uniref:polyphenol oxidase family protein n=1 Tax=Psychrobacter sp. B38 TaxID=3143538 RepID=UPI00320C2B1B
MSNKLPVTLLAQIEDVAVFQTAAFLGNGVDRLDSEHLHVDLNTATNQSANYGELNLGLHVKDEAAKVLTNRMRLLAAINEQLANVSSDSQSYMNVKSLHWVNQVHGKHICDVDTTLSMEPLAADAMISKQVGLGLAIMTADCVPIVLYQPASGQIAAIHAGWQGLACGIIQATVQRFTESGEIKAWIGVCISQANYEVGPHVRDQLLAGCAEAQSLTQSDLNKFDERYVIHRETQGLQQTADTLAKHTVEDAETDISKLKLNLPRLAADQLKAAEVTLADELPKECSYGDDCYYSYRRQTHLQQPATGRMALVIVRRASI